MTLNEILSKNITNGRFFAIEAKTKKKDGQAVLSSFNRRFRSL